MPTSSGRAPTVGPPPGFVGPPPGIEGPPPVGPWPGTGMMPLTTWVPSTIAASTAATMTVGRLPCGSRRPHHSRVRPATWVAVSRATCSAVATAGGGGDGVSPPAGGGAGGDEAA
ncbi:MAG: hypothetical protein FJ038_12810, partial [Chloroflexi bacterium]|nr:hypothetical protein [Chloroflexota bacterium]